MEFEFTYTPDDIHEAMKVKWPTPSEWKKTVGVILTLAFIGILLFEIWSGSSSQDWKMNFLLQQDGHWSFDTFFQDYGRALLTLLLFVTWISHYLLSRSRGGLALWKANPNVQQPQTLWVDDENGIKASSPLSESLFRWSIFHFWAETAGLFVLRLSSNGLLIIPKRAVSPDQMAQLRTLLNEKIIPPAKGFPVLLANEAQAETKDNRSNVL